jgi:hypothetical protein
MELSGETLTANLVKAFPRIFLDPTTRPLPKWVPFRSQMAPHDSHFSIIFLNRMDNPLIHLDKITNKTVTVIYTRFSHHFDP